MNKNYNFNSFMKKCKCKNQDDLGLQVDKGLQIDFPCYDRINLQGSASIDSRTTKTERINQYLKFHCYKKNTKDPYTYLDRRGLINTPYVDVIQQSNVFNNPKGINQNKKNNLEFLGKLKQQNFISTIQRTIP